jgi:hypothetical protein
MGLGSSSLFGGDLALVIHLPQSNKLKKDSSIQIPVTFAIDNGMRQ